MATLGFSPQVASQPLRSLVRVKALLQEVAIHQWPACDGRPSSCRASQAIGAAKPALRSSCAALPCVCCQIDLNTAIAASSAAR